MDSGLLSIPGYAVLGSLGRGGMGKVYLAQDLALGRRVALKVVAEGFVGEAGEEARRRFRRESQTMAQLDHPNVVRVWAGDEHAGTGYLVMELIEGETLADLLRRRGRLDPAEALGLLAQVAEGLRAAWELRIVHRDVKPSNVLIDHAGTPKVADFGLARPAAGGRDLEVTQPGEVLGSPHYMAPERALGAPDDFRGDVYSLGIVLFEMLAGHLPFKGDTALSLLVQHREKPLPDLREARPELPEGVVRLVERMTEKDPAGRPASYDELLAEIARLRTGRGATVAVAVPRPMARRRLLAPALAGLVLLLLAAGGWSLARQRRAGAPGGTPAERSEATPEAAAKVVVHSFPPKSRLFLEGEEIGTTPVEMAPPPRLARLVLRRPGFEEAMVPWPGTGPELRVRLRPEPFAPAPGTAPAELVRGLERLRTDAFGIDWAPQGWHEPGAPAPGDPLQVRVEVDRAVWPLLLFLDEGGDLYQLVPSGLEPGVALAPGQAALLPPGGDPVRLEEGGGWLVLVACSAPLTQPVVHGARPEPGRYTFYAARRDERELLFPAVDYLTWLAGRLRSGDLEWDLRTLDVRAAALSGSKSTG